jgi:hypothetical protein
VLGADAGAVGMGWGSVSDTDSSLWAGNLRPDLRLMLAIYATVLVAAVKILGDSNHPMGRARGKPTRYSLPASAGNKTPNLETSDARNQMR